MGEGYQSFPSAFAEVNPFTTTVDAMRALFLGAPAGNDVWAAVAWSIGLSGLLLARGVPLPARGRAVIQLVVR